MLAGTVALRGGVRGGQRLCAAPQEFILVLAIISFLAHDARAGALDSEVTHTFQLARAPLIMNSCQGYISAELRACVTQQETLCAGRRQRSPSSSSTPQATATSSGCGCNWVGLRSP